MVQSATSQVTSIRNAQSAVLRLHILQRASIGVLAILPGPLVANLQTTGVTYGTSKPYQTVLVELHNGGTMIIHPHGYLYIRDTAGHLLQNLPLKLNAIMPQDSIEYPVYTRNKALQIGTYQTELELDYEQNKHLRSISSFAITVPAAILFPEASNLVSLTLPTADIRSILLYIIGGLTIFFIAGGFVLWRNRRGQMSKWFKRKL